jgi:flavodoxin
MPRRVLVVCYSRSGTTLRVAEHIAAALDADLERIEEIGSRAGFGGYLRSAWEALGKGLPAIRTSKDPGQYDLVVLGGPVWVGTMCSPIRSYILRHRKQLLRPAFFAVMGGRGGEDTVREMQLAAEAGRTPMCVLTQRDVEQGLFREKCEGFVQALKDAARGQPSTVRMAAAGQA